MYSEESLLPQRCAMEKKMEPPFTPAIRFISKNRLSSVLLACVAP